MRRAIEDFHPDEEGDWVADLACFHSQHVRHRPPFRDRPWVLSESGRAERIGTELDCPPCDRAEAPEGLLVVRTAGPFDAGTIPAALRNDHRVAARTWGRVRVIAGSVGFAMATTPPHQGQLIAGDQRSIPPDVPHRLIVDGPVEVAVDFLTRPAMAARPGG